MSGTHLQESGSNIHFNHGKLVLRFGPMFSGKTGWLKGKISYFFGLKRRILVINHVSDDRNSTGETYGAGSLSSHDPVYERLPPGVDTMKLHQLSDATDKVENYHIICIDEAQFFDDLVKTVKYWVNTLNRCVYVAGLDSDYMGEPFNIISLIPHAADAKKITGSCNLCMDELSGFHGDVESKSVTTIRTTSNNERLLVGSNNYVPVCGYHAHVYRDFTIYSEHK